MPKAPMLLRHRAAQAQAEPHAFPPRGSKKGVNRRCATSGGQCRSPGRPARTHAPPVLRLSTTRRVSSDPRCRGLVHRLQSRCAPGSAGACSTMVRSHHDGGQPAIHPAIHAGAQLAGLQLHQGQDRVEQAGPMHPGARSRRRTKSCTLWMMLRHAVPGLRSGAGHPRTVAPAGRAIAQQVDRSGGIARDRRQRLVQLVAQQRGHLAGSSQRRWPCRSARRESSSTRRCT